MQDSESMRMLTKNTEGKNIASASSLGAKPKPQNSLLSTEDLSHSSAASYDSGLCSMEFLPNFDFNINSEETTEDTGKTTSPSNTKSQQHCSFNFLPSITESKEMSTGLGSFENIFQNMNINQKKHVERCSSKSSSVHEENSDSGNYSLEPREESLCSCVRTDDNSMEDEAMEAAHVCRCNDSSAQPSVQEQLWLCDEHKDGDNALNYNILLGNTEATLQLINHVPSYEMLNYCNNVGQTALHLAVLTNQATVVRRLICAGADVDLQDLQGETPLHSACRLGNKDIVKHFLKPVVYEETIENNYDIPFQRLPRDMRVRNCEGQTCLHIAASFLYLDIVSMLLEAGADVNMGDYKSGRTVLHMAAELNSESLLLLLLSRKDIVINANDYAGFTPADLALGRNHHNILERLYRFSLCWPAALSDNSDADFSDEG